MNTIITLISDWRTRDPYLAMFKGEILSSLQDACIIDITHTVDMFNVAQTAFLSRNSYKKFPEGTFHLMLTNVSENDTFDPVIVEYDRHFFVGNDNGVFRLMFDRHLPLSGKKYAAEGPAGAWTKMIALVKAAAAQELDHITQPYDTFVEQLPHLPMYDENQRRIEGEIVYIDAFCNAITNIPVAMFKEAVKECPFEAYINAKKMWKCQKYHETYIPEKDDEFYLAGNALGYVEVAVFQGNIAVLMDLKVGDQITIECK